MAQEKIFLQEMRESIVLEMLSGESSSEISCKKEY